MNPLHHGSISACLILAHNLLGSCLMNCVLMDASIPMALNSIEVENLFSYMIHIIYVENDNRIGW